MSCRQLCRIVAFFVCLPLARLEVSVVRRERPSRHEFQDVYHQRTHQHQVLTEDELLDIREALRHAEDADKIASEYTSRYSKSPHLQDIIKRKVASVNEEVRAEEKKRAEDKKLRGGDMEIQSKDEAGEAEVVDAEGGQDDADEDDAAKEAADEKAEKEKEQASLLQNYHSQDPAQTGITVPNHAVISLKFRDARGIKYLKALPDSGCGPSPPVACTRLNNESLPSHGCVSLVADASAKSRFRIHQAGTTYSTEITKQGLTALESLDLLHSNHSHYGYFLGVCPSTGNLQWFELERDVSHGRHGRPKLLSSAFECQFLIHWEVDASLGSSLTTARDVKFKSVTHTASGTAGYMLNWRIRGLGDGYNEYSNDYSYGVVQSHVDAAVQPELVDWSNWEIECECPADCSASCGGI